MKNSYSHLQGIYNLLRRIYPQSSSLSQNPLTELPLLRTLPSRPTPALVLSVTEASDKTSPLLSLNPRSPYIQKPRSHHIRPRPLSVPLSCITFSLPALSLMYFFLMDISRDAAGSASTCSYNLHRTEPLVF